MSGVTGLFNINLFVHILDCFRSDDCLDNCYDCKTATRIYNTFYSILTFLLSGCPVGVFQL